MVADNYIFYSSAITVRDYIAIQAMQSMISNTSFVPEYSASEVACVAYGYADEMIKKSNESKKE